MKIVYFRESERSSWFPVQNVGGSNHPSLGVSFSCDVVIGVVEVDRDISGFVTVERTKRNPTLFVVFTAIESLYITNHRLAADNWFTLQDATHMAKQGHRLTLEIHGHGSP
jgi:hypothetical protein